MRDLESWIKELIDKNELWRFYKSREFMQLRDEVLSEQHHECYLCRQEGKITRATIVHHVKHVRDYPRLALSKYYIDEDGNKQIQLMCVCFKCHEVKCHPNRFKDSRNKQNEDRNKEINNKYPERW